VSIKVRAMLASAVAGLLVLAGLFMVKPASAYLQTNGQTRAVTGCNISRGTNAMIVYTRTGTRTRTGTNTAGVEVAFLNGRITAVQDGVGNMSIPVGGAVVSGHGTSRTWLLANARLNANAELRPTCANVPNPSPPNNTVTINGASFTAAGCNIHRAANTLVVYSRLYGATVSPANAYGFEALVQNGVITQVRNGQTGMAIPLGGAVLSGHGVARTWLQTHANTGARVTLPSCTGLPTSTNPTVSPSPSTSTSPPPNGSPMRLPDLRLRPASQFSIDTTSQPGVRQLRFRAVTANVGAGPFEINGTRSSTTQSHVVTQRVYHQDGTTSVLSARPGAVQNAEFYFAGDGHNHWHVRDIDQFQLHDIGTNALLRTQEKHGFCFEDNTEYRNWPSDGLNGTPRNPVYLPGQTCGAGLPNALNIQEGISVGWSDTYSPTLPDQWINVTTLPNGDYRLRQTADWDNWFTESNENNNSAWTDIRINGNTVTVLAEGGGA
jgi:hypothetical protein